MRFTLKNALFGLAAGLQIAFVGAQAAQATVPEWHLVRLNDKAKGFLHCRENPSKSARSIASFREGTALEVTAVDGEFGRVTRSSKGDSGCYVALQFLQKADVDHLYGILYKGRYEVTASSLTCRSFPGINAPVFGSAIPKGRTIDSVGVGFDFGGQSWLQLNNGCFVVGDPNYLQWRGAGEDPNTMCHYMKENC